MQNFPVCTDDAAQFEIALKAHEVKRLPENVHQGNIRIKKPFRRDSFNRQINISCPVGCLSGTAKQDHPPGPHSHQYIHGYGQS